MFGHVRPRLGIGMISSIQIVLPVFIFFGLGYFAIWARLIEPQADKALSAFVFSFCLPALIFRTISRADLPAVQPWGYWISYFTGVALAWGVATLISRRFFGANQIESAIAGFAAGQSNTAFLGIPLILSVYGETGAVPLFLLMAVHLPITMTAATIAVEGKAKFDLPFVRRVASNPVSIGLILGVLWRESGLVAGVAMNTIVDELASASVPCALFAMGLSLHRFGLRGNIRLVSCIGVLKLLVHPGLVFLLAHKFFVMPPAWSGVCVLFAAMPTGINSYLFAEFNKSYVPEASSAVALTTLFAPLTIAFWLWLLGM